MFEITGFFVHGKEILFEIAKSSRWRCSRTGLICVPNCIGKRREIVFVRDRGKFEITVFEIAEVDCRSNIWRILSQFEPSEKVQSQQLPGAPPPRPLPGLCPGPASGLTVPPRPPAVWAMTLSLHVCVARSLRLARRKKWLGKFTMLAPPIKMPNFCHCELQSWVTSRSAP